MDGSVAQTYLGDVLHAISQALLAPDMVLLIAFVAYALFCIGSVIAECFSERRHFNVAMPKFLAELMAAEEDEIPAVIERSGLLNRQKKALLTVYDYRILPGDALIALIKRLVNEEESRYDRIAGRNNMAARVSPMLGLMGTLIPLGPGIQALGKADTAALSSSLLVAFDTTVAGLVVAAVCLVIGKIRGNWYGNYMSALDSAMATMLQKIEDMRAAGKIQVQKPTDYAFLFESKTGKESKKKGSKREMTLPSGPDTSAPNAEQASSRPADVALASAAPAATTASTAASDTMSSFASNAYGRKEGASQAGASQFAASPDPLPRVNGILNQTSASAAAAFQQKPQTADQPASSSYAGGYTQASQSQASNLVNTVPSVQVAGQSQATSASFGKSSLGSTLPSLDATTSRVAPPVEEVPMPSFLDALASSVPAVNPSTENAATPQQVTSANQGWYQPQLRTDGSGQPYKQDMPLWGTARSAGAQHADGQNK